MRTICSAVHGRSRPAVGSCDERDAFKADDRRGEMAKIGFLGLGMMGSPMASRLLDAGNDVTVWNRTASKAKPLVDRGASLAARRPRPGWGRVVITMLANPAALEEVLFGDDGLVGALHAGQMLIDMSTVGLMPSLKLPAGCPRRRVRGRARARQRAGGDRWTPPWSSSGPPTRRPSGGRVARAARVDPPRGPPGAGAAMKLVANRRWAPRSRGSAKPGSRREPWAGAHPTARRLGGNATGCRAQT